MNSPATSVDISVFQEIHILQVLRELNRTCFKRKTLSLKKDDSEEIKVVHIRGTGTISDHYENLLRRICLIQGAKSVQVHREKILNRTLTEMIDKYSIMIAMPRLNNAIDASKAMMIGDTDLLAVAAQQELQLDRESIEDDFQSAWTTSLQDTSRTLQ